MFEKLITALPFNPSLLNQLAFYGKRMRQEEAVRRTGLIFIVLAFSIQFFAVLSPPQATMAASSNDLINGGITSAADASQNCSSNVQSYQTIMNHYGISCADISRGATLTIKSTDANKQLFSMGRLPYGKTNANSGKATSETPVKITGLSTLYVRYLWSFDTGAYSSYKALKITSTLTHKTYYILYSCGNLVSIGLPVPYVKPVPTPIPTPKPTPTPTPTPIPTPTPTPKPTPVPMCQYNSTIPSSDVNCKPCDQAVSSADTLACVVVHKAATNVTAGVSDANNTMAHAGDTIEYTLFAQNNGKANVKDFVFQENMNDVLDYATIVDLHGGQLDANNIVTWPVASINAAATVQQQITVQVKNPIPQTPVSTSDGGHFDLTMTNVYGNTINITLPGDVTKTVETVAATLPNTGPGTSLFFGAAIVVLAGYFFSRARLLATETSIAINDNNSGGF